MPRRVGYLGGEKRYSFARIELLCDQTEDGDGSHEEHGIVELEDISTVRRPVDGGALAAFLETALSSSSVLASMKSLRRFGKLAC